MLLDCSEATYGQLYDHFQDKETLDKILINLRVIFISHMHGDHCMGISKVLYERALAIQVKYTAEEIANNPSDFIIYVCLPYFLENLVKEIPFVQIIYTQKLNPETEKYYYNDDPIYSEE